MTGLPFACLPPAAQQLVIELPIDEVMRLATALCIAPFGFALEELEPGRWAVSYAGRALGVVD